MRTSLEETLQTVGIMVIDGSMSTSLEALGCDLNDSLWTAKALAECPGLVEQVHRDFFRAGADCGITCSYQATIPGLMAKGYPLAQGEALISRSVPCSSGPGRPGGKRKARPPAGPIPSAWGRWDPMGPIWRTGRNTGGITGCRTRYCGTSTGGGWSCSGRRGRTCF